MSEYRYMVIVNGQKPQKLKIYAPASKGDIVSFEDGGQKYEVTAIEHEHNWGSVIYAARCKDND